MLRVGDQVPRFGKGDVPLDRLRVVPCGAGHDRCTLDDLHFTRYREQIEHRELALARGLRRVLAEGLGRC